MTGILNTSDQLLNDAEAKLESQIAPNIREAYLKVVNAGLQIATHGGPNSILAQIKNSRNVIHDCAMGAIGLVLQVSKASRGTMPPKAGIPASYTLMLKGLDTAEKAGMIHVTPDLLVQATAIWHRAILPVFGVPTKTAAGLIVKAHKVMQDPTSVEKMNRRAGVTKDPNASTPTTIPQEA